MTEVTKLFLILGSWKLTLAMDKEQSAIEHKAIANVRNWYWLYNFSSSNPRRDKEHKETQKLKKIKRLRKYIRKGKIKIGKCDI